jgi:hypothetical protein
MVLGQSAMLFGGEHHEHDDPIKHLGIPTHDYSNVQ